MSEQRIEKKPAAEGALHFSMPRAIGLLLVHTGGQRLEWTPALGGEKLVTVQVGEENLRAGLDLIRNLVIVFRQGGSNGCRFGGGARGNLPVIQVGATIAADNAWTTDEVRASLDH